MFLSLLKNKSANAIDVAETWDEVEQIARDLFALAKQDMQDQPQSQTMPEQSDDVEESDDAGSVLHLVHSMMMLKMVKNKMATLVPMVSLMTVKNLMKMLTVRLATFLLMIPKKKKIPIPRQNQKRSLVILI